MSDILRTNPVELEQLIDALAQQAQQMNVRPEVVQQLKQELRERHQAEQALRDSEARLRAIVSAAVDGIITIDERGRVESLNPAAERIFGYASAEVVGQNVKMLMPEPYHSQHDQYLANYLATRKPKIIGIGREVVGKRKDGSTFPMDLAVSEVQLGQRKMFTGIVRDITERKQAEHELLRAKETAEAANAAKDQFLAVLSHELRTPLTPVLATMTFVESMSDLPPELQTEISAIRRNVEMEARLIDDLLDLTRISRGKIELHHEVLDAHASLRNALEICQADIEAKELEVSLNLRAKQHHIWADPARMQQVFWNLVKNAVKFTPEGGRISLRSRNVESDEEPENGGTGEGEREADKETRRQGDEGTNSAALPIENRKSKIENSPDSALSTQHSALLIEITDTGIGIEPEALGRIFNAFEQGERTVTRTFGGLGLGLTISKALVEMHHGKLSATSQGKDKGATFALELATVPAGPERLRSPESKSGTWSSARQKNKKELKILLVEDHEDTLRVMTNLLRHFGYIVRGASSVQKALELAGKEKFDLLISDLGLPDGSGLDVMRSVRAHYQVKGIALSGFGMDEDIRRSREAGFEQHLTKPINVQALETAIQRAAS